MVGGTGGHRMTYLSGNLNRLLAVLAAAVFLSACTVEEGFFRPVREEPEEPSGINVTELLNGGLNQGARLPVNQFIWQASLDTVDVLPLAAVDPFSGVIATDWGSANASTQERYRLNVFVTSVELTVDSLRVAAFRQEFRAGRWVDAPLDPEVARSVEDAILLRARQLRIAENG